MSAKIFAQDEELFHLWPFASAPYATNPGRFRVGRAERGAGSIGPDGACG